jgi:hypothetical protein
MPRCIPKKDSGHIACFLFHTKPLPWAIIEPTGKQAGPRVVLSQLEFAVRINRKILELSEFEATVNVDCQSADWESHIYGSTIAFTRQRSSLDKSSTLAKRHASARL